MPSVLQQPTRSPASRPRWATSRATARPSATASRCRGHGQATISSPAPGPGRPRTGRRAVPASATMRRTRWAASRVAKRARRSLPGSPGAAAPGRPARPATAAASSTGRAVSTAASRTSCTAGPGNQRLAPSRTRRSAAGAMPVTILGALMDPRSHPAGLLPLARSRSERALASLELLVNRDSGSYSVEGVNRVADLCEERMRGGGWTVERLAHRPAAGEARLGDLVIGRRQGTRPVEAGGRRLLLMAHMDTVFDDGAAAARPFRVEGGRAYGPGVADDKCGLVAGIEAVEVLCDDAAFDDFAAVTLACTPDEEIGSPFSKDVLTRLAGEHEVGIGLEAARVNGALVTSRKGISACEIGIQGKAVHAGVRPKEGINAALEAARKTEALQALNGRWPGVTCNVGVIRAGTRPNVVAERAELQLDLRAVTSVEFERALAAVREIAATSYVPGTTASLEVVHRHPPMERTEAVADLLAEARRVAAALGFELREAASGGAGDANTTAAAGLPTIDGFGPVGGEAHGAAGRLPRPRRRGGAALVGLARNGQRQTAGRRTLYCLYDLSSCSRRPATQTGPAARRRAGGVGRWRGRGRAPRSPPRSGGSRSP